MTTTEERPTVQPAPRRRGPQHRRRRPRGWWRKPALVVGALVVAVVVLMVVVVHGSGGGTGSVADPAQAASTSGVSLDPAAFATGACVAFSPTHGARNRTVFLDAGHGGIDPGAVGTTQSGAPVREAAVTLPVALDAATLLRADGYRVVLSRTRSTTVLKPGPGDLSSTGGVLTQQGGHDDVVARDACANLAKATVLVGISFATATSSTGAGSTVAYDIERHFSGENRQLADLLENDVVVDLHDQGWAIPDDGVVTDAAMTTTDTHYHHLLLLGPTARAWHPVPSQMPGALIEPLYLSDPSEATMAASGAGQRAIARGIAQAAQQYLASARS